MQSDYELSIPSFDKFAGFENDKLLSINDYRFEGKEEEKNCVIIFSSKLELLPLLSGKDKEIVEIGTNERNKGPRVNKLIAKGKLCGIENGNQEHSHWGTAILACLVMFCFWVS